MNDVLKYAFENGMIDIGSIKNQFEMKKREELLNKHVYKIWEGTNGKWYTYLPDDVHGRTLKKRNSRSIKNLLIRPGRHVAHCYWIIM